MSLIRFNNNPDVIINARLFIDHRGRIEVVFNNENDVPEESILLGGFVELNEHNHIEQSDFSNMTFLYRKKDDITCILTDKEDDIYEPDPDNPQNQDAEIVPPTLDEVKELKISQLSQICNNMIVYGVNMIVDGNMEHFSYLEEDQTNIKELFDLALQTNVPLFYHSDGNSCKLYTVEQIIMLYTTQAMNKMHHATYFNQLKMYLNTLEDIEEINSIEYGHLLDGEFLNTYNTAMEQARLGMETLLAKRNENTTDTDTPENIDTPDDTENYVTNENIETGTENNPAPVENETLNTNENQ